LVRCGLSGVLEERDAVAARDLKRRTDAGQTLA